MDDRYTTFALYALGAAALAVGLRKLKARIELSRAKHRSLAGHSCMSRRVAALVPFYDYDEETVFRSDGAPGEIAQRAAPASCGSPRSTTPSSPRRAG